MITESKSTCLILQLRAGLNTNCWSLSNLTECLVKSKWFELEKVNFRFKILRFVKYKAEPEWGMEDLLFYSLRPFFTMFLGQMLLKLPGRWTNNLLITLTQNSDITWFRQDSDKIQTFFIRFNYIKFLLIHLEKTGSIPKKWWVLAWARKHCNIF